MPLQYLTDLWDDTIVAGMDEPEQLRYRSNLLGSDRRLTNFGGGNTSAKIDMPDPLTGETVNVLWVKGSGGDLGTIRREGFARLYRTALDSLKSRYRGAEFEDEMVALYPLCAFGNHRTAPSIDTPLHAFLPFPHVDHLHPDWAISLAASANGLGLTERLRDESGIKLVWLPWKRPGFELGLRLEEAAAENPDADGILLGSHGLFTWGRTSRESYTNTLRVLDAIGRFVVPRVEARGTALFGGRVVEDRADRRELALRLMPALRRQIRQGAIIGHFSDDPETLRFVGSAQAKELAWQGTSCPDHFVRTKVRPMLVEWDAASGDADTLIAAASAGFPEYRAAYARYYEENRADDSPAMRSPEPTVVLVPGVGMFSFGKNKTEARITGEFYLNAIHVMEGATTLADLAPPTDPPPQVGPGQAAGSVTENYVALPPNEAFRIEYWSLEEAKLQRMPPEKELSRRIAVVIGVGSGIGMAIATRLAAEGAHVVCGDLKPEFADQASDELNRQFGPETAIAAVADCTERASVRRLMEAAVAHFGGVDLLVCVAAVFFAPDEDGRITEDQWRKTFDVNLLGSYVPADEAIRTMRVSGNGGSVVLISSANAVVAKKGSFAYDTSKAALNHLVRELAVEAGDAGIRVNGVAPASVVEGSLQFPRERVLSSLAKYRIAFDESETTEELRAKLAAFYAERSLLKRRVTPAAVAEAVFLLASEKRTGLMTGQVLPVDAGLTEAFLR
ncbi:MAG: bifunctional rhamnulose-1-phosphate aldolase/short-chain dehydrogenase [Capsulimonadales bacterium]|nr:bifunctional rhamnulose-1-phosphate aldolase/short-chain dehydrogenase [Capsulimonadales bacterium]